MTYSTKQSGTFGLTVSASALPVWRQGLPLLQWRELTGTTFVTNASRSAAIAAGLLDGGGSGTIYGVFGDLMHYSGAAFRQAGSSMLLFGGGGAGAWAGNDVVALHFDRDVPVYETIVNPSPTSVVWPRVPPPHPYMQDGVSPNARHSYLVHQFCDTLDRGLLFGGANEWEMDTGTWGNVDSYTWAGRTWIKDYGPAMIADPNFDRDLGDDVPVVMHPTTEDVYRKTASKWYKYSRASSYTSYTTFTLTSSAHGLAGTIALHPTLNLLVWVGRDINGTNNAGYCTTINISTGASQKFAMTGDSPSVIGSTGAGLCWVPDPGWNAFALFTDNGQLYKIDVTSASAASCNLVATTEFAAGHRPPAGVSEPHRGGVPAIWSRMHYSRNLKGLCLLQAKSVNARFIRTG